MNEKEFGAELKNAFDSVTPDIRDSVLSDCKKKGKVIKMESSNTKKKRPALRIAAAVAAALLLLAAAPFAIKVFMGQKHTAVASVMIDVNPSIEMTVDKDERVIEAIPRNTDGAVLLEGMDLSGSKVSVALDAIIGSLVRKGYLNELANSVLISVNGEDLDLCARLRETLSIDAAALLNTSDFGYAVMSQQIEADENVSRIAEDYGITTSKAQLIYSLHELNTHYELSSLAALSINELGLLYGKKADGAIETKGASSDRSFIGEEAALAIAYGDAGITPDEAADTEIELDLENAVMVYDIEFRANGVEHDYEIDAVTGAILRHDTENEGAAPTETAPVNTPEATPAPEYIGRKAALRAAYEHADVSEDSVYDVEIETDRENGRLVYEIEFKSGAKEYEYTVDALTGEILHHECESQHTDKPTAKPTAKPTPKPTAKPNSSSYIGRTAALNAALDHAGVSVDAVHDIEIELDRENGKAVYEVEFSVGKTEYDYTVDAVTGEILTHSSEGGHSGHHSGGGSIDLIGEARAWEIALNKAKLTMEDVTGKEIELDHENGVYSYELEFRSGKYEYEVKINAVTGAVMRFEKELDD